MTIIRETRAVYDARPEMNWSRLRPILISPRAYYTREQRPRTSAMALGIHGHSILLEGVTSVVFEGTRRGAKWDEFQATHCDHPIVSCAEYETIMRVRSALEAHDDAARLLRDGIIEGTAVGAVHDLPAKCRFDVFDPVDRVLVDLKLTGGAIDARSWSRHAATLGYHQQAAWYRELTAATDCYLVAAQTRWPYEVAVFRYEPDALAAGLADCCEAVDRYRECEETGWYGSHAQPGIQPLDLPTWHYPAEGDALEGCE